MLTHHELRDAEIDAWRLAAAAEFQRRAGMTEYQAEAYANACWDVALELHSRDVDAAVLSDPLEAVEVELSYWGE